jgi:hypothetical protein
VAGVLLLQDSHLTQAKPQPAFVAWQLAGAHIADVNAGHLSMIADPGTVAQVIEQAAQATS